VRFLLDTDTCIFALKHNPGVLAQMQKLSPGDIAVSAMNEAELRYGALNSQNPARSLKEVEAFLVPIQVLPFDADASRDHARLRLALKSKPIGERDLVVASVAASHRLTVVTHNVKEFGRVPGLKVTDWFVPLVPSPSNKGRK